MPCGSGVVAVGEGPGAVATADAARRGSAMVGGALRLSVMVGGARHWTTMSAESVTAS